MAAAIVLLVDDNPTRRMAGVMRLRDASYYVEIATCASEALEKANQIVPDAILSDVMLADLDGYGLCRLLRNEVALAEVPIVLLCDVDGEPPDHHLANRVGASAVVERSADFENELSALRRCQAATAHPQADATDTSLYAEHLRSNAKQISRLRGRARIAQERYPALLRNARDTITFLTTDGHVLEGNDRWLDITGIDPKAMIGRHIRDLSPPEDADARVASYREGLARGRAAPVRFVTPSGDTVHMEFTTTVTVYEGSTTVLAIGRDVTERVEAAARVTAAEEKYRQLVERLPDVIWTSTSDGMVTFITPNVERVLGTPVDQVVGRRLASGTAAIHESDRATVDEGLRRLCEVGGPFDLEYRRIGPKGDWIWVRHRSTARYERDGVTYIEGMITDISEDRRREAALRQVQKLDALAQLTGGIAHDFNNLLEVILAHSVFLRDDLGAQDPRREDALRIAEAAQQAAALTRQLLAFSRRQVLAPSVVELNHALGRVEPLLRRLIGEDITFGIDLAADLGSVSVDLGQLEQVIVNLVVNARDAMPAGGTLTVRTENVELRDPAVAAALELTVGSYVALTVRDTGCGMSAETRARIFEPFFTTKEVGRGAGLGLAECDGIAKQSGGHISVSSALEVGSELRLYLPRIAAEQPRVRARSTSRHGMLGGTETILIVEDDQHVRAAVRRMLKPHGYTLLVADGARAAEAIVAAHVGSIDLVVSDVLMPGQNGPEVVKDVLARFPEARTIYMSGNPDHPVLRSGAFPTTTAFLQKPFGPEQLARKVREVLDS